MVERVLVEKKPGFDVEARSLTKDLVQTLGLDENIKIRIINCYDLEGVDHEDFNRIVKTVLSEPNVDRIHGVLTHDGYEAFRVAYLPGQYDQRADSAAQCIEIVTLKERPEVLSSKIYLVEGASLAELDQIKKYLINPVESHEVPLEVPESLDMHLHQPSEVPCVEGFIQMDKPTLTNFLNEMGMAMSIDDLVFVQTYFNEEKRNPTMTELKVIDTYWSDHCRHTTFMTELTEIKFEEGKFKPAMEKAFDHYVSLRDYVYPLKERSVSLMDLATINMKSLRRSGGLEDLDVSDEINACSVKVDVNVDGKQEPWLLMFKNETHNHPTEIEPYGGAATCLGGAIRDPLSGRSYVYQSMRVTGSADPRIPISETMEGKLPQKVITQKAAVGFSGYGNQIGLATGLVSEVYDPGYVAKRMEVGAVIGATPAHHVVRQKPEPGDVILLVGGATGRDGIGGATGSSKSHDEESLLTCGAEVQKGNAPEERKIQRLFRNDAVTKLIKKCNDFGAGGVSVAIGELSDSLEIDLDMIVKKYEGLDGTELAISESQERMAVVVKASDADKMIELCHAENLEAKKVARVTDSGRLIMHYRGQEVLNLSRAFLDTNGVKGRMAVEVKAPGEKTFFETQEKRPLDELVQDLNICSQRGLVERFDNTIGAGTVLMPFGGVSESTPVQTMVAKFPVLHGETDTVSMMSYGFNPEIGKWSPFHGGYYAVVESVAKLVATGADYKKIRLSLQEYFEKLGNDPAKWGKPFAALLGASHAQSQFGIAAIGGKDSMSGSFKDIGVPPTLISFAVSTESAKHIISPEFKRPGSKVCLWKAGRTEDELLDFDALLHGYREIYNAITNGEILAAYAVGKGGSLASIAKMAFGNAMGVSIDYKNASILYEEMIGSLILEIPEKIDSKLEQLGELLVLGRTNKSGKIEFDGTSSDVHHLVEKWESPLASVFPPLHTGGGVAKKFEYKVRNSHKPSLSFAKPRVIVPVFPGTNCEYDTAAAFEKAGASVETLVFRNRTQNDLRESLEVLKNRIDAAQILALPGGFSAGDEPDGSGKFIASILRNPQVAESVMRLIKERDGLILGICNGFQALVKLGLLPYGEIRDLDLDAPTLTFNKIGRHVAKMGNVRVASVKSPWFSGVNVGDVYKTAFSHGEGRFYASAELVDQLAKKGQIATQYVDPDGNPTYDGRYNLNDSVEAIEGITSEDGRILGKMGHIERMGQHLYKNIHGNTKFDILSSGVGYYK